MACTYKLNSTGVVYSVSDFDDYLKSLPHEVIAKYSPVVAALLGKSDRGSVNFDSIEDLINSSTTMQKSDWIERVKVNNLDLYNSTLRQLKAKSKPINDINVFALLKTKLIGSKNNFNERNKAGRKVWFNPSLIKDTLLKNGFELIETSIGNRSSKASDVGFPSSYSAYYKNNKTGVTARVSDHAPAYARSTGYDLSFYPDSHKDDNHAVDSILSKSGKSFADVKSEISSLGVKLLTSESGDSITVNNITVPPENRNSGIGTKSMKIILDYADSVGKKVVLTPSSDFGGNKSRLVSFYKRLGFVENKGANKDYAISETMYREPSGTKFSKSTQQTTSSTVAQVKSWLPKRVQAMLDSGKLQVVQSVNDLPANLRGVGEAMFHKVWHGSPHDHNKFDSAKIGTGEGAQAFGYGHYFTDGQGIAEWYRDKLSKSRGRAEIIIDGKVNNDELINRIATNLLFNYDLGRDVGSISKQDLIDRLEDDRYAFDDEDIAENADDAARAKKLDNLISRLSKAKDVSITLVNEKGKLYEVELAPTQDEYLDWDKPLSEQSNTIRSKFGYNNAYADQYNEALDKALKKYGSRLKLSTQATQAEKDSIKELGVKAGILKDTDSGLVGKDGKQLYKDLAENKGGDKAASDYLHSIGIRGIRYKADQGNSDANNYVIFSDDDITITNKYSQLNGIQGLYDVKTDKTYLVADMLTKDNTNIVLSHELFHRFYAKDTKAKAIMNKMMFGIRESFDQASRGKGSKTELSAYQRVIKAKTPKKDQVEEYLAYQISSFLENPKNVAPTLANLIKNWIASIRMALLRYSMDLGFVRSLTPRDLVALSQYGSRVNSVANSQSKLALASSGNSKFSVAPRRLTDAWIDWWNNSMFARTDKETGRKEPIKFYHATNAPDLTFFDKEKLGSNTTTHATSGLGFFFSPIKEDVQQYGSNLVEVYLSAKKVYAVNSYELPMFNSLDEAKKFSKSLQKKGYDGIWLKDAKYAIVFESNQAKLTSNEEPTQSPDIRYSFLGENAQTADKYQLSTAQERTANGEDAEQVRKDTGWFKGVDGKWRFEIDDSEAKIIAPLTQDKFKGESKLGDVLQHDALFNAYPWLRDIKVKPENGGSVGSFNGDTITVTPQPKWNMNIYKNAAKSTLLHEIQHAIQKQEGFASGGSVAQFAHGRMFNKKARDITADLSELLTGGISAQPNEIIPELKKHPNDKDVLKIAKEYDFDTVEKIIEFLNKEDVKRTPFGQYQRLAGEIEARNTQSRLGLTAEQRRNTPPSQTQDIPDSEAIVVWNNVEMRSEPANADSANFNVIRKLTASMANDILSEARVGGKHKNSGWTAGGREVPDDESGYILASIPMSAIRENADGNRYDDTVDISRAMDYAKLNISTPIRLLYNERTAKKHNTAYVFDGGHRVTAARLTGKQSINAIMSEDDYNRLIKTHIENADNGVRFSVAGDIETGLPEETRTEKFQRKAQDKFNRFRVIQEHKEIELAKDNGYTGNNIFDARQFLKDNGIKNVIRDETDVYQAESINAGISTEKVKDFEEKVMKPLVKEAARAKIKMADISDFLLMRYALSKPELGISTAEANNALHHYRHRTDFAQLESIADKWQQQTAIAQQEMIRAGMSPSNELLPIEIPKQRSGESNADYNNRLVSSVKGQDMVTNIIHDYEKAINAIEKNKIAVTAANFIKEANDTAIGILNPSKAPSDGKFTYYVGGVEHTAQFNDELLARAFKERGMEQLGAVLNMTRNFNNFLSRAYTAYSPTFLIKNPIRDAIQGMITNTSKFGLGMASDIFKAYPHAAKELWNHFRNHGSSAEVDRYRRAGGSTGAAYLSDVERLGSEIMDAYNEYAGAIDTYNRVYLAEINAGSTPKVAAFKASFKAAKAGLNETPLIGHFMKFMENANSITENALRLATFTTLVNSGYSDAKAAAAAKDLLNFNRKGELGSQVGAMYLFFNPSAQGSQVLFSALKTNEHKKQALALAGIIALSAFLIAETMRGGGDDDEEKWKMLPNNLKDRNFIFGSGDTKIMIPVPYGYGVFHSFGNAISDIFHGESTYKASIRMAAAMFDNFSPFGNPIDSEHDLFQLMPTIPKMVMSPSVNENNFGSPIQPDKWSNAKPDSENMYRGTKGTIYSTIARGLNELSGGSKYEQGKISISPETLKFWTTTLTGGTGTFFADTFNLGSIAVQGVEPSLKDIPIAKAFAHEISVQDARQAFWKDLKEAQLATDEFSLAKKAHDRPAMMAIKNDKRDLIALAKVGNRYQKMAASTRDQIDRIRLDDSLTLQQKRDKQKALEAKEMAVYAKFLAIFDKKRG